MRTIENHTNRDKQIAKKEGDIRKIDKSPLELSGKRNSF